jgi:hypothetical protein
MKQQIEWDGMSKIDKWLINSDWTKSARYFLAFFLIWGGWQAYDSYIDYQAGDYWSAVISSFGVGIMFTSALYYILIMVNYATQAKLRKENTALLIANFELRKELKQRDTQKTTD